MTRTLLNIDAVACSHHDGDTEQACRRTVAALTALPSGLVRRALDLFEAIPGKPRYVVAFWSPEEEPDALISSFNFKERKKNESIYEVYGNLEELETERSRYDLGWVTVNSEVPIQGILKNSKS